jgi:carbonic anhydrase
LIGASAAALAFRPWLARAAGGDYQAMILGCIDPRMQEPVRDYAVKQKLVGQYSSFTIASAAIGVVAPAFDQWHKTFWDNLAASIELHNIKSVIAIDHRDCSAAKIAYGDASIATPEAETETHRKALAEFRNEVGQRQPRLKIETLLMALDGSVVSLS